jgi:hypothetical protein
MELKKITLKKEVVANMSDNEMARLMGLAGFGTILDNTKVTDNCTKLTGCVGNTCPIWECYQPDPDTGYDDPNYSAEGSGCDAETCGPAWTCNGR